MKKDTFFNNSTERAKVDTTQPTSKSKRKIFKAFGFGSLAVMMAVAGTFAFAPLGASPSVAGASTVDQINTKADGENIKYAPSALGLDPENDPVIYTTASGLEIKYGGASVNNSLPSGALAGYPYFTMGTYSGYAVNWVIIGRNTNDTVFTDAISSYLYSTWKTNNNVSYVGSQPLAKYWFNGGGYETTTPAGSAINGVVPSKSYVADVTKATKTVVGNDEVPSGCVLAISENCVGSTKYNPVTSNQYEGSGLQTHCQNLYNNTTSNGGLGLTSAQKKLVKPQNLISACAPNQTTCSSTNQFMFPLAWEYKKIDGSLWGENFMLRTYLGTYTTGSSALWKADQQWYTRGANGSSATQYLLIQSDGSLNSSASNSTYGVRPACVIKLA